MSASLSGRSAVAVLFQAGAAGALWRATSVPLRYAMNPSSVFTRSNSGENPAGFAVVNGARM
ncbi:MAG: hypothetical protein U1F77_06835 [Kiritimatiellia bacterium]